MIKGDKHPSVITDNDILHFMSIIDVDPSIYKLDNGSYAFEFVYHGIVCDFDVSITFKDFISEFSKSFYTEGYIDACQYIDNKISNSCFYNIDDHCEENWNFHRKDKKY